MAHLANLDKHPWMSGFPFGFVCFHGYLFCRVPLIFHHVSHILYNCPLALSNYYPKACVPVQGGSLYHIYGGLWYNPAGMPTHDLPCEKRTR